MIVYFKKEDFKNSFKLNIFCYKDNGDKYDLFKDDLWFEFHNIDPDNFDCNANFIACALLMHCMKNGENLNIRGGGDIELLRNLENFQDVYCSWMPSVWKKIKINFDFIKPLIETNKRQKGNRAVMAEEQVLAYRYEGKRYDCGSKIGYLEATLAMARKHPEVGGAFEALLHRMLTAA